MVLFTPDKKKYCLNDFRKVAIWGAGDLGEQLFDELLEKGIQIAFYIDGKPQNRTYRETRIYLLSEVPKNAWEDVDCIFFAFITHRTAVENALVDAGINKPVFYYPNEYIYNMDMYFDFRKSREDINLLSYLEEYLAGVTGPLAFYGNDRLCRYILDVCPGLKKQIDCLFDNGTTSEMATIYDVPVYPVEDGQRNVQTVFFAETNSERLYMMYERIQNWNVTIITLELIEKTRPEIIPARAVFEKHELEYPVDVPDCHIRQELDVLLLEPPGRLMPIILPNGLGVVHTILDQPDINLQTIDYNITLYHRFHKNRLMQKGAGDLSGSYQMKEEPWARENWEQWSKPEFVQYFAEEIRVLIGSIVRARPKIVGISLNMINRLFAKKIVNGIREHLNDVVIVVGGPDCQYYEFGPRKFDAFDYMVINQAEPVLLNLIQRILSGEKVKDCPGIVSRCDSDLWEWEPSDKKVDLDDYGFPEYQWTSMETYRNYEGHIITAPISTNRGCKWGKCRFCTECLPYHGRSPKLVVDEIEWLAKQNYRIISLNDSDTNSNQDTLLEICREIVRRDLSVSLYGQFRIDRRNTYQFFQILKQAGFGSIVFGVDGWSDNLLVQQRKGYTMAIVEQNLKDCQAAGIIASVNMVLGVPGETEEDVDAIIDNAIRNKHHMAIGQVTLFSLAAGSEYYNNPEKYGIQFNGDKTEIYTRCMDTNIDPGLWYSTSPHIDLSIRMNRLERIYRKLLQEGIVFDHFCRELISNTLNNEAGVSS